jgi:hypothetical protein
MQISGQLSNFKCRKLVAENVFLNEHKMWREFKVAKNGCCRNEMLANLNDTIKLRTDNKSAAAVTQRVAVSRDEMSF